MTGVWKLPAVLGAMTAVALVVGAAEADANGFFGEITAAWVQAVGSVAAIMVSAGIALWIDQGAARRTREERAETRRATIRHRGMAIALARSAVKLCEKAVSELPLLPSIQPFPGKAIQALRGADDMLQALTLQPLDLSEDLMTALILTRRVAANVADRLEAGVLIATEVHREKLIEQLKDQAKGIEAFRAKVPDWKELAAQH